MTGKRSNDKRHVNAWILASLHDRFQRIARRRDITDTQAVAEALTEWADRHETTDITTRGENPS
jgi:cytidylate kinase